MRWLVCGSAHHWHRFVNRHSLGTTCTACVHGTSLQEMNCSRYGSIMHTLDLTEHCCRVGYTKEPTTTPWLYQKKVGSVAQGRGIQPPPNSPSTFATDLMWAHTVMQYPSILIVMCRVWRTQWATHNPRFPFTLCMAAPSTQSSQPATYNGKWQERAAIDHMYNAALYSGGLRRWCCDAVGQCLGAAH